MRNGTPPGWRQWGGALGLAVLLGAVPAGAQDAESPGDTPKDERTRAEDGRAEPVGLDDFKVVGSRLPGRSAAEAPVPVDVIDGDDLRNYGVRDLNNLLAATVPSYNIAQHAIGSQDTLVRPAKLRGLPPDSTLVLVNGKRRHRSSAISFFTFGVAKGSHGADISTIPSIALERVEVLRDGAAAQYGSDAVAGVLNFVLRDAPEGGTLEARWGQHYHGDGDLANVAANVGLPLTDAGFANLSFEFTNSDSTNRSVQRADALPLIAAGNEHVRTSPVQVWGAPDVNYDYKFFGNLGLDLGAHHHVYAFGNWAERDIEDSWFYRHPSNFGQVFTDPFGPNNGGGPNTELLVADLTPDGSGGCPTVPTENYLPDPAALAKVRADPDCDTFALMFPGGFTPRWNGVVTDWSLAFGLRGTLHHPAALLDGWQYDLSGGFGRHRIVGRVRNSINPNLIRLGAAIPTEYRVSGYKERDMIFNADVSRPFDVGPFASPLHVAFGLEYREEEFENETGEPNSWYRDETLVAQGFLNGVTGQQGTPPRDAGEASRGIFGAYLDLEADVIEDVLLTAAGRYENHAGIGDSLDGKLASRWELLDDVLAVRGSIGTGFRAPTVGQVNYRRATTGVDRTRGVLAEVTTLPVDDPIARRVGADPLQPEHSTSFSLGAVVTLGDLSVTIDYYDIEVRNRIALSSDFSLDDRGADGRTHRAALRAAGIDVPGLSLVRYFTNDFGTTTRGVDVVATYPLEWLRGRTLFTFAGNWNDSKVDSHGPSLRDYHVAHIEEIDPEFRFTFTADHRFGPWRFLTRWHYYDDFHSFPGLSTLRNRTHAHARALMDLEASYTFFDTGVTLAFGAQNLFDTYPTRNRGAGVFGEKYPVTSPYGFNGGFYYVRAGFEWG